MQLVLFSLIPSILLPHPATALRVTLGPSWFKLIRFHCQHICMAAAAKLLVLALAENAIAVVENLQITLIVLRILARER